MEIRDNENICIYTPLSPVLNKRESEKLFSEVMNDERKIALDLSLVNDCTADFIEGLKEISQKKEIGIFNIQSDMFALFNFFNLDKIVKLFVTEQDFENNIRQLINRRFTVLNKV